MTRPIRILHIVGSLDRGGIETWLMHVLRHIDRRHFRMDFLVHTNRPAAYDEQARDLGAHVLACPHAGQPVRYARAFSRILRDSGPYDVVHSHVHHFSGFVVRLAQRAGVPVRVAHSHLDTSERDARSGILRRFYLRQMVRWIHAHATWRLAASALAAVSLFGSAWRRDPRTALHYCAIDLAPYHGAIDCASVRRSLGLPTDTFVAGHVGRFDSQKNHPFLIQVAVELTKLAREFRLLLVGDGAGVAEARRQVAELGIADRVIFAGPRDDVARLLRGVVDVFLLPSYHEGLPLVVLEAQAAGVPAVISDRVTEEVAVVPGLVRRLPLGDPLAWAREALAHRRPVGLTPSMALAGVEASRFNIHTAVRHLEGLYSKELEGADARAVAG